METQTLISIKLPTEPATRERSLVIRYDEAKKEYAVHYYNHDYDGYYDGCYVKTIEEAIKEYEKRLSYHMKNYSVWIEKFFLLRDRVFNISNAIYDLSTLMRNSLIESKMIQKDD